MTITIPVWLLWVLGGFGGVVILLLAAIGIMFLWNFRNGIGW